MENKVITRCKSPFTGLIITKISEIQAKVSLIILSKLEIKLNINSEADKVHSKTCPNVDPDKNDDLSERKDKKTDENDEIIQINKNLMMHLMTLPYCCLLICLIRFQNYTCTTDKISISQINMDSLVDQTQINRKINPVRY